MNLFSTKVGKGVKPVLRLIRVYEDSSGFGTFGVLVDDHGVTVCRTAELNWRSNRKGISCIPPGTYDCVAHTSKSFGSCFLVKDVPGRSDILLHVGNWAGMKGVPGVLSDTEGCILPGVSVGVVFDKRSGRSQIAVSNSGRTLGRLLAGYPDGFTFIVEGV